MTDGKYVQRRRRRRRQTNLGLWIVALVLFAAIIALIVMMARSCDTDPADSTKPNPSLNIQTEPSDTPTEPTTEPTAEPTAEPTTEATEPSTEATEPSTEATEPSTEATEPSTEATEPSTEPVPPSSFGQQIADFAALQLGKEYLYGGVGPDKFDTSGFVYYCFQENGINCPRALKKQATYGVEVSKDDLQPGDVVFFWTNEPGKIQYPTIYIGDGKIIAARNSENPVSEMSMNNSYFSERYITARRFG